MNGYVEVIVKLANHCTATAMAIAALRILLGNISDNNTQMIGPQLIINDAEQITINTNAITPNVELAVITLIPIIPISIPIDPIITYAFRQNVSTYKVA